MIDFLSQAWPWHVSGPLVATVMFLLLLAGGEFGVSSTLRTLCAMGGAGSKINYFKIDWRAQLWNITFVFGAILGGYIAAHYLTEPDTLIISQSTISDLHALGISFDQSLIPESIFNWNNIFTGQGILFIIVGGFLIGFGTRWAGGCTSGHAISGLSNFQLPSLIAVIGFFIGGLVMTHLLFPLIFN